VWPGVGAGGGNNEMTTKTMSNCGWSGLNNNTAKKRRQKKQQRETIVEFSKKNCSKMRSTAKLWLE
jgi:hypothetical protein